MTSAVAHEHARRVEVGRDTPLKTRSHARNESLSMRYMQESSFNCNRLERRGGAGCERERGHPARRPPGESSFFVTSISLPCRYHMPMLEKNQVVLDIILKSSNNLGTILRPRNSRISAAKSCAPLGRGLRSTKTKKREEKGQARTNLLKQIQSKRKKKNEWTCYLRGFFYE